MTSKLRFLIVGGHGKVAQHLTRHALKNGHTVYSLIRNPDHASDLPKPPASQDELLQPVVFSLEAESVSSVADVLKKHKPNVVVFAAGAGGKGGQERTRAVDYEGAVKVFDALEQSKIVEQPDFHRFLLVSAVDSRDPETSKPDWYGEEDYARSQKTREAIGYYMQMKYEADKNLSQRKAFPWFVLRPGGLSDEPSKNGVMLGERKTITVPVSREDVGKVLLAVAEQPRGSKIDGLMLDLTNGSDKDIDSAVQAAAERGRTDWLD